MKIECEHEYCHDEKYESFKFCKKCLNTLIEGSCYCSCNTKK